MKKILFAVLMGVVALDVNAQLVVDSIGNVIIGSDSTSLTVTGAIKCNGREDDAVYAFNGRTLSEGAGKTIVGFKTITLNGAGRSYGVHAQTRGSASNSFPVVGIAGQGGNNPVSAGVFGGATSLTNATSFAGIYGSTGYAVSPQFTYTGFYAGYFKGNVRVTSGSIYATVLSPSATSGSGNTEGVNVISSDSEGESVTDKLAQVQTIQFMRDKRDMSSSETYTDGLTEEEKATLKAEGIDFDAESEARKAKESSLSAVQYGLAADQLKNVYPELVYEDAQGNVSINYIELIPLLVQSINELSRKVASLEGQKMAKAKATGVEESESDTDQVRMSQNKPNPFSGSTAIAPMVAEETNTANIYDLNGRRVQTPTKGIYIRDGKKMAY